MVWNILLISRTKWILIFWFIVMWNVLLILIKNKLPVITIFWFIVAWNILSLSRKNEWFMITLFWFVLVWNILIFSCKKILIFHYNILIFWVKDFVHFTQKWVILIAIFWIVVWYEIFCLFLAKSEWLMITIFEFDVVWNILPVSRKSGLSMTVVYIRCGVEYFAYFSQKINK